MPGNEARVSSVSGPNWAVAVMELFQTIELLVKDVNMCAAALDLARRGTTESEFWRRTYVRASFALFEGAIERLRVFAYSCRRNPEIEFSPVELEQLQGTSWRQPVIDQIEFALSAVARVTCVSWVPRVGRDVRRHFRVAKLTRDRLTHPRVLTDLAVVDSELQSVHEFSEWMGRQVADLSQAIPHTWPRQFDSADPKGTRAKM